MIYALKKDNYKNFSVFKENVLEPRSYFIPFSSEKELNETDIRTERYHSSMVAVLSGDGSLSIMKNALICRSLLIRSRKTAM